MTIELPLTAISGATTVDPLRVHSRATPLQPNFSKATSLAGVTVLVVDDEPDARELIKQVLEDHQAHVLVATSAQEARQVMNAQRPDVLLSDIGMVGQDGYQLVAEIRREGNSIPAVALTAFARSEDRTRALRAGFQMHIAKPVEPEELLAAVASLVQRARLRNDLRDGTSM